MYINQILELSMILDHERFHKVFKRAYSKTACMGDKEDEYIDRSLEGKGMTVIYRDSQYKKKVRVVVNMEQLLNGSKPDPDKIVRKINKRIGEYFSFKYTMEDFFLSGIRFVTDMNVGSSKNVRAYLKVFQRIGRVKGFSTVSYEGFEDVDSFCLDGNSNSIEFLIYDLENYVAQRLRKTDIEQKKLESVIKESGGILRTEVRLTKPKVIRDYMDAVEVSGQIEELSEKCQDIFLDIFTRIIPFGDCYKKDKAVEIIRNEVGDIRLRRKMFRLVALIPEKKSLYLAQKSMKCRNIEKVMDAFAKINLSPVVISKRQDIRYLKNIYEYLCK